MHAVVLYIPHPDSLSTVYVIFETSSGVCIVEFYIQEILLLCIQEIFVQLGCHFSLTFFSRLVPLNDIYHVSTR